MSADTDTASIAEQRDDCYVGGLWLSHETTHLLIAAGMIEGSDENGHTWTAYGQNVMSKHLTGFARRYYE